MPKEAIHYVQYDQGEDRWLCTLILQQGWRVEYSAASDSFTHCPEAFGEFFNQRRRWAPSTMANIIDLLREFKHTVKVNENISTPYILYQAALMIGTILSPGTIFLMLIGAVNTAFGLSHNNSFLMNFIPIIAFILVCFFTKDKIQILFAQILSTLYALLMLAVLVSTAIQMKEEGIWSPSVFFFVLICASFVIAAILHPQEFLCVIPGVLYLLCIPSMYLLLTIYSIINLNNVNWGTREVKQKPTEEQQKSQPQSKGGFFSGFLSHRTQTRTPGHNPWCCSCTCCCSQDKDEDEREKLLEIKEEIVKTREEMQAVKYKLDPVYTDQPKTHQSPVRKNAHFASNLTSVNESQHSEWENVQIHVDNAEEKNDQRNSIPKFPKWTKDEALKNGVVVSLRSKELDFWKIFIYDYLKPLVENKEKKEKISRDLIDLRNQVVFAFGILNALFILFVFLFQMHKDQFHINWPVGSDTNKTYNEETDEYEDHKVGRYVAIDPIGLILVLFFGVVILIQFIGMIIHRFGTLAHLLASTDLDCCSKRDRYSNDDLNINNNAVMIIKSLQKLPEEAEKIVDDELGEPEAFGKHKKVHLKLDDVVQKQLDRLSTQPHGKLLVKYYKLVNLSSNFF